MSFSYDEFYAASIEAKDKKNNEHFDREKIKEINHKLDEVLLDFVDIHINSLRGAFNGIEDYIFLPEYERNNNLITNIEASLFSNTGLKPSLFTLGVSNRDILSYTYYGLYLTNIIKGSRYISGIYLLKTFIYNPRIARYDLAPSVYDDFFKPQLIEYYNTLSQFVPKDPRRKFNNRDNQPFLLMERFEKNIIIHNEEFEKNIDDQCIEIAKMVMGDYNLW